MTSRHNNRRNRFEKKVVDCFFYSRDLRISDDFGLLDYVLPCCAGLGNSLFLHQKLALVRAVTRLRRLGGSHQLGAAVLRFPSHGQPGTLMADVATQRAPILRSAIAELVISVLTHFARRKRWIQFVNGQALAHCQPCPLTVVFIIGAAYLACANQMERHRRLFGLVGGIFWA